MLHFLHGFAFEGHIDDAVIVFRKRFQVLQGKRSPCKGVIQMVHVPCLEIFYAVFPDCHLQGIRSAVQLWEHKMCDSQLLKLRKLRDFLFQSFNFFTEAPCGSPVFCLFKLHFHLLELYDPF